MVGVCLKGFSLRLWRRLRLGPACGSAPLRLCRCLGPRCLGPCDSTPAAARPPLRLCRRMWGEAPPRR